MFLFQVTHRKTNLFGKTQKIRDTPDSCIPVTEAKAWRQELEERALRHGMISAEELEGSRPDWHGDFIEWQNEKERMTALDQLHAEGLSISDLMKGFGERLGDHP